MEQKHKLKYFMIPIISMVVFLLLVFGAGYAYYTATIRVGNITNVNAALPSYNATLITTGGECAINVQGADMIQSKANNTVPIRSSVCTLNLTMEGLPGLPFVYGVVLEDVSDEPYTSSYDNEFVFNLTFSESSRLGSTAYMFSPTFNGSSGKYQEQSIEITNMSFQKLYDNRINGINYTYTNGNMPEVTDKTYALHTSNSKVAPLAISVIEIPAGRTSYTQTYTLRENWFNLEGIDQSAQANKTYKYRLKIVNVEDYLGSVSGSSNGINQTFYFASYSPGIGDNIVDYAHNYDYSIDDFATSPYGLINDYGDEVYSFIRTTVENDIVTNIEACINYVRNNNSTIMCLKPDNYGSYTGMSSTTVSSVSNATGTIADLQSFYNPSNGITCRFNSNNSYCNSSNPYFYIEAASNGLVSAIDDNYWRCQVADITGGYCWPD